ncbi:putative molybdenum carrier protein [soil metagenome]
MIWLSKMVSGGQTGADRAALDWAIARGIPHQGWCPAGRRSEDGPLDRRYLLRETPGEGYLERTRWNVRDSDGTVIFTLGPDLAGGSLATWNHARALEKPVTHISRALSGNPAADLDRFLETYGIQVLNVAGPRASGEPGVGAFVHDVLDALVVAHESACVPPRSTK